MKRLLQTPLSKRGRKGQALPEYGLIIALISLASFVILTQFGQQLHDGFMDFAARCQQAAAAG